MSNSVHIYPYKFNLALCGALYIIIFLLLTFAFVSSHYSMSRLNRSSHLGIHQQTNVCWRLSSLVNKQFGLGCALGRAALCVQMTTSVYANGVCLTLHNNQLY